MVAMLFFLSRDTENLPLQRTTQHIPIHRSLTIDELRVLLLVGVHPGVAPAPNCRSHALRMRWRLAVEHSPDSVWFYSGYAI